MKVGTDAVMLGAWINVEDSVRILDVGTGCGVIALMLAQRSTAEIHGIELDNASAEQAKFNFNNSPWRNRLELIRSSFQKYIANTLQSYDAVVSNPPFFEGDLLSGKKNRSVSKHALNLSHEELLAGTARILNDHGRFCLILPVREAQLFEEKAKIAGLQPCRKLTIYPKPGAKPNRIMMEYTKKRKPKSEAYLTIRNSDGSHTDDYRSLTRDYYLNF